MIYPANILNLNPFKLTLPTGLFANLPQNGVPDEIHQPELSSYTDEYFYRKGSGVIFHAPVGGIVQSGSKYPRCELREMSLDGSQLASWSPSVGRHTMTLVQQVIALPKNKPEAVIGQIHDATGFVLLIWARGHADGINADLIARSITGFDVPLQTFVIGTSVLTTHIEVVKGRINVNDGAFDTDWPTGGCYFKTGCYVQSNLSTDAASEYGEVLTRNIAITHQP